MELTDNIKEKAESADVILTDDEMDEVEGGYDPWRQYAKGSYVNYGQYIVYTVVGGDALPGIAIRFGVTVPQICQWNNIKNPDLIYINQKLTIYPTILR
ncbi:MAG: LysM peptidoglycan-binding domain-containing protein [Firmicutes bacterium]|nr:LysM peptidoglycan-binding domain-containing protein [Bacillota bacterium]